MTSKKSIYQNLDLLIAAATAGLFELPPTHKIDKPKNETHEQKMARKKAERAKR